MASTEEESDELDQRMDLCNSLSHDQAKTRKQKKHKGSNATTDTHTHLFFLEHQYCFRGPFNRSFGVKCSKSSLCVHICILFSLSNCEVSATLNRPKQHPPQLLNAQAPSSWKPSISSEFGPHSHSPMVFCSRP